MAIPPSIENLDGVLFEFVDTWRISATREELVECFLDLADVSRWWPACFLRTEILSMGDENGNGGEIRALTKGCLPYCLNVVIRVEESDPFRRYRIKFKGDLNGTTNLEVNFKGELTEMIFTSSLNVTKPIIRKAPSLFYPIFASNHYWVMHRGEIGLQSEILRIRNKDVPYRPITIPGPTFPHNLSWVVDRISWKDCVK